MRTYITRCILIVFLISFLLGCNPFQEMREGREAAERANKEAKMVLEKVKEYSEKAEAAAQRAEKSAVSAESFTKKAEAASEKPVGKVPLGVDGKEFDRAAAKSSGV